MTRRWWFWLVLVLLSAASAFVAVRFFPRAFSIVALDIGMHRERALEEARAIMARDGMGPAGYRQAASFALDGDAQTFVELEGGGKDAFTSMLRDGLYAAYTWRVRHFKEGETNETTIRFTPAGRAYGFVEKIREDAPGAALDAAPAREIAERGVARWNVDLAQFGLVEQGQERRTSGRIDHTLTYERAAPTLNEGRYRLRLVVAGDRLTEVTHQVRIPEAFRRRYENMRSANQAIGIGSVVGMALLYIFGGIGVGLFYMLRKRWVIWRPAALWGLAVGAMQALAMWNELPHWWMDYDTAIARSTFLAERTAYIVASFVGFSVFFALSFTAAETLTRKAFGRHPQLWRLWSTRSADGTAPGASIDVLGRTAAGYLLVPVFLAYVVMFYYAAFRYLGWWSPSEALLHPDVLATYVPWLSAVANSFQAGFWEETLFRAVPLAGAALIGERVGQRRLFLIVAFVVQAVIFGAGHAEYPGQPAYARPVELLVPSMGFALLYLYFGLLPAIVLHFTFDVVLFALPIFVASAPGLWIQKAMVVVLALVPLWIVLVRRVQVRRWTTLAPADRNAAWTPPPAAAAEMVEPAMPAAELPARARAWWIWAGAASAVACIAAIAAAWRPGGHVLPVAREQAAQLVRAALAQQGVTLDRRWRVLPVADNGAQGAHEFVAATAGEARRRELVGRYLPSPRWRVRIATFEGDVVDRAEEWSAFVLPTGEVRGIQHVLPEGRAGAALDEASARELARQALIDRFALDGRRGDVKEVSNRPAKLNARTDWTFTFVDTTAPPLPQGEPRIRIDIAGDKIAAASRFVFVPEHWQRLQRAAGTRNLILSIFGTMVFAGLLVGAAVTGVVAWSRRRYTPRLFFAGAALMLAVSVAKNVLDWPQTLALLRTSAPLELQLTGIVGIGLVGLMLSALLVGLALGALPERLTNHPAMPDRTLAPGLAAGCFGAAVLLTAGALRSPDWAAVPNLDSAGAMIPLLRTAIDPLTRVIMGSAIVVPGFILVGQLTSGWTRRRAAGAVLLVLLGFAASGVPAGIDTSRWLAAGGVTAAALLLAYVTLFRYDLAVVPTALGTMTAIAALMRGAERAYPWALTGSAVAAGLAVACGWWLSRALSRARAQRLASVAAAGEPPLFTLRPPPVS